MNTHDIDIELPAEFRSGNSIPVERATITRERMTEILQDAIEADRKRRGEPVAYHPCTPILIEGLKRLPGGSAILAEWDKARSKVDATQPAESVEVVGKPPVPSDDVLADALSNLEHDNYEQSYSGYKNRQADIGLIRAAIEADCKHRFENGKALRRYKECGGDEEKDPIERLRFYCSLAMSGQDWLDVQPFFDDLVADRQRRIKGDGE